MENKFDLFLARLQKLLLIGLITFLFVWFGLQIRESIYRTDYYMKEIFLLDSINFPR